MGGVRAYLFGRTRIEVSGGAARVPIPPRSQLLFSYLLVHRDQAHTREILAEVLWPGQEPERARHSLSSALYRLKRVLLAAGVNPADIFATTSTDEIAVSEACPCWIDIAEFDSRAGSLVNRRSEELTAKQVESLEQTIKLYKGDALDGVYEEWALRERERLQSLLLVACHLLMDWYRDGGRFEEALAIGHRMLRCDALREDVHHQLMKLYIAGGNRAGALRQYRDLHRLLSIELNVAPMPEIQSLYRSLFDDRRPAGADPASSVHPNRVLPRFREIRGKLFSLGEASRRLLADVDEIKRLIDAPER